MNYRHAFHAGNFADVLKHLVLMAVLQTLHKKEKPFFVMDTHAGVGRYDLESREAERSPEYRDGILPLWKASQEEFPPLLQQYMHFIARTNEEAHQPQGALRFYAGSPLFIQHLIRPQDRALLCEKHPDDALRLQNVIGWSRNISVREDDGYSMLVSHVPPPEVRGVILVDPPFEERNEFQTLFQTVKNSVKRWPTGIFVIWYPVKDESANHFEEQIATLRPSNRLDPFVHIYTLKRPSEGTRLTETRMMVIQSPYPSHDQIMACLPILEDILNMKTSHYDF